MQCSCETIPGLGGVHKLCGAHAEAVVRALAAEREMCAKIADVMAAQYFALTQKYERGEDQRVAMGQRVAAANIAGQIRQRKQPQ